MHKASVPLGRETRSALVDRLRDPVVVLQVLGDRDSSRIPLPHFAIDPLDEAPAVGQVAARIAVSPHVVHKQRHVEPQAVDVILLQPHQGVVADELAHFLAAVVGASRAPRGSRHASRCRSRCRPAVLAPAVKLPQIEIAGAEVVVDDVQDHRQAGSMRRFDEPLEAGSDRRSWFPRRKRKRGCIPTTTRRRTRPRASLR